MKIIEDGPNVTIKLDSDEPKPEIRLLWKIVCDLPECRRVAWKAKKPRADRRQYCQISHAQLAAVRAYRGRQADKN